MDLVFSDTDLGADVLSQVDAASHACLGEDSINFEFNQHLLVREICEAHARRPREDPRPELVGHHR